MESLNGHISEYTKQLKIGSIQKAYRGIMGFMSALKSDMESKYPGYTSSALYFGYMDMTYFAFTPLELKKKSLKIAIVYLHEENRIEAWLGDGYRKVQADYFEKLRHRDIGSCKLSRVSPGVDSILEMEILKQPDFDHVEDLMQTIGSRTIAFAESVLSILDE